MGHILSGSMDTYYDKTKIDELRKEYSKLIFKPQCQRVISELESLRLFAEIIGINHTQLIEYKKNELGRDLTDEERFQLIQEKVKIEIQELRKSKLNIDKALEIRETDKEFLGKPLIDPVTPFNEQTSNAFEMKKVIQPKMRMLTKETSIELTQVDKRVHQTKEENKYNSNLDQFL